MHTKYLSRELHIPLNFHLNKNLINERGALYLTHTMRGFALSLVGIFLPIYIFDLAQVNTLFSINPTINGLIWILSYFFLTSLSALLFLIFFTNLVFNKLHFRWSILLSLCTLAMQTLFWLLAAKNLYAIFPAGLLNGFTVVTYWLPYHIAFVRKKTEQKGKFGKDISVRALLEKIFTGIGPVIGGLFITNFGFSALFTTSLLMIILAGFPVLIMMPEETHSNHNVTQTFKAYFSNKKYKYTTLSLIGASIEDLVFAIFWSVLLFLVLNDFAKLGFLKSISLVLSSLIVIYVGNLIDSKGTKKVHLVGVIINSLLYIPRILTNNLIVFYADDLLDRINGNLYVLPRLSLEYKIGSKDHISDFVIYREFTIHLTRLIFCVLAALFILKFNWQLVFIFAIVGSLMTYLIELDDK